MMAWRADWNKFVRDVLKARLDSEQQAIISSVQHNKMTAVASGTARGKDFVAACAALCFLYLTPRFDRHGNMVKNTKIALTAPTGRQVSNIMMPEIRRLFRAAGFLPGRMVANDIRTDYDEWFLTGFKADDDYTEAWSGFHAVNTMFVITEASGISEKTFNAIEGNLQGNSRLLLVFNPNTTIGYAAQAMKSERFTHFRLNSLHAENVVAREVKIPGQVDYDWVCDKVDTWCQHISKEERNEAEGDFEWEGQWYRPNDLFRVKVLGMFPKVSNDVLIPYEWIALAQRRWEEYHLPNKVNCVIGIDVAGMGRDNSVFCYRYGNYVDKFLKHNSCGKADHMKVAGRAVESLKTIGNSALSIDTIGEGAGVYSRLLELGTTNAERIVSCKFSAGAKDKHGKTLTDITGQYTFANMRAYLFWCVRDWLNPANETGAMLPSGGSLAEEATEIKWSFRSDGSIIIEPKEDIIKRLGHSTDEFDALANTFHPAALAAIRTKRQTESVDLEEILW